MASISAISNLSLAQAFLPALVVVAIMVYWRVIAAAIYLTLAKKNVEE